MKISELMTPHEKQELLRLVTKLPTTTPCNLCRNYDCGRCQLADAMIPDNVKNVGCESWTFDPNSPPF
jgi:hypothetical protein